MISCSGSKLTLPVLPPVLPPVGLLGVEQVVPLAEQAEPVERRLPSTGSSIDVIDLELPAAVATLPVGSHPGAAAFVPLPDLPAHLGGDEGGVFRGHGLHLA